MPHHPVKVLYSAMYLNFCKTINIKPLELEAFAKEFKLISDQFPMIQWKRGESNNFYIGFNVKGEYAEYYNSLINISILDTVNIFE